MLVHLFRRLVFLFLGLDDRLAAVFIAVVGVAGIGGYFLGGAVIIAFLGSVGIGCLLAPQLAYAFGPAVSEFLGTEGVFNHILTAGVGLMTVGFLAMLVVEIVWNRLLGARYGVQYYNQTVGLMLGAIQGAFLALLVFGGIHFAAPHAPQLATSPPSSVQEFNYKTTVRAVTKLNKSLRASYIGPLVARHNLFQRLPTMRKLRAQRNISKLSRDRGSVQRSTLLAASDLVNRRR